MAQGQVADVQAEISRFETVMVTEQQFGSSQGRGEKLEVTGIGRDWGSKSLHFQLVPLYPANESFLRHDVCDIKIARRTRMMEVILSETVGCPKPVGVEYLRGCKTDERALTDVRLIEFRNRRDVALHFLTGKTGHI